MKSGQFLSQNAPHYLKKTHSHYNRRKHQPTDVPKLAEPNAHHLMDTVAELLCTKDPRNCYCLEEADPENGHPARGIKVHKLENVDSPLETNVILVMVNKSN